MSIDDRDIRFLLVQKKSDSLKNHSHTTVEMFIEPGKPFKPWIQSPSKKGIYLTADMMKRIVTTIRETYIKITGKDLIDPFELQDNSDIDKLMVQWQALTNILIKHYAKTISDHYKKILHERIEELKICVKNAEHREEN